MFNKSKCVLILILIFICSVLVYSQQSNSKSRRRADKFTFNNKSRTVTYEGNTRMEDTDSLIRSDKMVFYIDLERGDFSGNVSMLDKKNGTIIYSGLANYDGIKKFADAKINPRLVSKENNLTIRSTLMKRDFNTDFAVAQGNVRLVHINEENGTQTDGYSNFLDYNLKTKIAYMVGSPRVVQKGDILKGEIIEYNIDSDVVNVMGGAIGYIVPRTNENTNSTTTNNIKEPIDKRYSKFTNYNIIRADRFEFETSTNKNADRMIYAYGDVSIYYPEENMILSGQELVYNISSNYAVFRHNPVAKIPKQKTIIFSDWLEYKTDGDYKDIIFHDNVLMFDYEEATSMEAQALVLDPDSKIATSKGEPITYLEDMQIRIKAKTFQRFNSHEKLRANGNVIIDQKDINAKSDWALYYDKDRLMKLFGGNPVIKQKESIIRAREIVYDLNTGKIESTRVSGVLE